MYVGYTSKTFKKIPQLLNVAKLKKDWRKKEKKLMLTKVAHQIPRILRSLEMQINRLVLRKFKSCSISLTFYWLWIEFLSIILSLFRLYIILFLVLCWPSLDPQINSNMYLYLVHLHIVDKWALKPAAIIICLFVSSSKRGVIQTLLFSYVFENLQN